MLLCDHEVHGDLHVETEDVLQVDSDAQVVMVDEDSGSVKEDLVISALNNSSMRSMKCSYCTLKYYY